MYEWNTCGFLIDHFTCIWWALYPWANTTHQQIQNSTLLKEYTVAVYISTQNILHWKSCKGAGILVDYSQVCLNAKRVYILEMILCHWVVNTLWTANYPLRMLLSMYCPCEFNFKCCLFYPEKKSTPVQTLKFCVHLIVFHCLLVFYNAI